MKLIKKKIFFLPASVVLLIIIFIFNSEQNNDLVLTNGFYLDGNLFPEEGNEVGQIKEIIATDRKFWKPYSRGPVEDIKNNTDFPPKKKVWIRFELPNAYKNHSYLSLSAVHDVEYIFMGNKRIYHNNKTRHIRYLDKGLKDWWLIIPLPENSKDNEIFLKLVSEQPPGVYGNIKAGEFEKLIKSEIKSDISYFSLSVSLILIGIFLMILLAFHERYLASYFWLCLLFFATGIITLTWSKLFFMLMDYSDSVRYIRIGILSFLPLFFTLFFQSINWSKSGFFNFWRNIIIIFSVLPAALILFQIVDIFQYSLFSILTFSASLGFIFFSGIMEIKTFNKNFKKEKKIKLPENIDVTLLFGLLIAIGAGFYDFLVIYNIVPYSSSLIPGGIFLMMILTALYVEKDFRKKQDQKEYTIRTLKEKTISLAGMSHEIRVPLTGIIGMSNLLYDTPLNEEQRGFLHTITTASRSLLNLINDVLDFAKLDSVQMHVEKEEFNLYETIENVIQIISPRAATQKNELLFYYHPDLPEKVIGDAARVSQVLTNLLGNAVKFTSNGDVEIRVHKINDNKKDWIEFLVKDSGIGIEKEKMANLFLPFSQADKSIYNKFGGTGLGLYISKKLVELMGGNISVTSTSGKGSTFKFRLPYLVLENQSSDLNQKPEKTTLNFQKNILIIGEHAGVSHMIEQFCNRLGYSGTVMPLRFISNSIPACMPGTGVPWDLVILICEEFCFEKLYLKKLYNESLVPLVVMMPVNLKQDYKELLEEIGIPHITGPATIGQLAEKLNILLHGPEAKPLLTSESKFAEQYPQNILVADDNPVNHTIAEKMFSHLGYQIDIASSGSEAVDMAISNFYDLIFMDIQMPGKNGLSASAEILRFWDGDLTPRIIAMTSDALREERIKFTNAGMVDCVLKPLTIDSLEKIIIRNAFFKKTKCGSK